jgi:hypothetical protein
MIEEHPLHKRLPEELELIRTLRAAFEARIAKYGISDEDAAQRLGLVPDGLENFRNFGEWTLEEAFRAATLIGVRYLLIERGDT